MNLHKQSSATDSDVMPRREVPALSIRNDFVALSVESIRFHKADMIYRGTLQLPGVRPDITERAVVAWISGAEKQPPIQSVGGLFGAPKR